MIVDDSAWPSGVLVLTILCCPVPRPFIGPVFPFPWEYIKRSRISNLTSLTLAQQCLLLVITQEITGLTKKCGRFKFLICLLLSLFFNIVNMVDFILNIEPVLNSWLLIFTFAFCV